MHVCILPHGPLAGEGQMYSRHGCPAPGVVLALQSTTALGLEALGKSSSKNNGLAAELCTDEERKPFVIPRP